MASDSTGSFTITSTDGQTWTAPVRQDDAHQGLQGQASSVTFDGTRFMIYTRYGGNAAYSSSDGTTWTRRPLTGNVEQAVYEEGAYFGIGSAGLVFSSDGLVWVSKHVLAANETNNINGPRLSVGRVLR